MTRISGTITHVTVDGQTYDLSPDQGYARIKPVTLWDRWGHLCKRFMRGKMLVPQGTWQPHFSDGELPDSIIVVNDITGWAFLFVEVDEDQLFTDLQTVCAFYPWTEAGGEPYVVKCCRALFAGGAEALWAVSFKSLEALS